MAYVHVSFITCVRSATVTLAISVQSSLLKATERTEWFKRLIKSVEEPNEFVVAICCDIPDPRYRVWPSLTFRLDPSHLDFGLYCSRCVPLEVVVMIVVAVVHLMVVVARAKARDGVPAGGTPMTTSTVVAMEAR